MIYKIAGSALILSASALSASRLISEEKAKIVQLETFIELVSYIRNQIDLYSAPIGKIFSDCKSSILTKLGISDVPSRFDEILGKSKLIIDSESQKTLYEFSESLGKNYREMQLKLCDRTIASLEERKKLLLSSFASRQKTILALCLGLGGITVIALF